MEKNDYNIVASLKCEFRIDRELNQVKKDAKSDNLRKQVIIHKKLN